MSQSHPPHLPPESCRVDTHYRLRSLRWTIFLVVIAFLSGTAAALSAVAWIAPMYILPAGSSVSIINNGQASNVKPADSVLTRQVEQRIVDIFDRRKKTGKMFYSEKTFVASAVVLSSDGWVAAYYPAYIVGEEKNWEAIDDQGLYYGFEKAVYDKVGELLYLKIIGDGFRITPFADSRGLANGQLLWAVERGEWQAVLLGDFLPEEIKGSAPIWRPKYFYSLSSALLDGVALFNNSGELVGISQSGKVTPAWLVSSQIGSLLEKKATQYKLINWKGLIINGVEWEGKWKNLTGFYISEASGLPANNTVKVGDVIIKINGDAVSDQTLAEKIFIAPDEFKVTVWRKGAEVEAVVKKEAVKP